MNNKLFPKAIIFDWDNTLVDTWTIIQKAIDETMIKMGHNPWGLEKVKKNVKNSMRESFPIIFGSEWQKAGEIYKNYYHANNLPKLVFLPDALELINKLYQLDIKLFVISNKLGTTLRKEVEHLGVKDKFFSVIGSMDAAYDKPSRQPVDLALEGSDLNPEKDLIWFIGDTIIDIECAYNSDCQPVLYGSGTSLSLDFISEERKKDKPLLHFLTHKEINEYFT